MSAQIGMCVGISAEDPLIHAPREELLRIVAALEDALRYETARAVRERASSRKNEAHLREQHRLGCAKCLEHMGTLGGISGVEADHLRRWARKVVEG